MRAGLWEAEKSCEDRQGSTGTSVPAAKRGLGDCTSSLHGNRPPRPSGSGRTACGAALQLRPLGWSHPPPEPGPELLPELVSHGAGRAAAGLTGTCQ